jgi:hypothetical protein
MFQQKFLSLVAITLLQVHHVLAGWIWASGLSNGGGWGFNDVLNTSSPANIPGGLNGHQALWWNGNLYLFAGNINNGYSNNIYVSRHSSSMITC